MANNQCLANYAQRMKEINTLEANAFEENEKCIIQSIKTPGGTQACQEALNKKLLGFRKDQAGAAQELAACIARSKE